MADGLLAAFLKSAEGTEKDDDYGTVKNEDGDDIKVKGLNEDPINITDALQALEEFQDTTVSNATRFKALEVLVKMITKSDKKRR